MVDFGFDMSSCGSQRNGIIIIIFIIYIVQISMRIELEHDHELDD